MDDLAGCHDMELLYLHRAAVDEQRRWEWLAKAERWRDLAQREMASLHTGHPGPMAMGPNTIEGDYLK